MPDTHARTRPLLALLVLVALEAAGLTGLAPAAAQSGEPSAAAPPGPIAAKALGDAAFSALEWREIGPYRGGRSAAVTGIPGQPEVYYFGSTGGGVWKTTDAGRTWSNISDGFFGGSIGAVAVSDWDPNVVYVGTGEVTVRGNVSHGDGMWKSTDAGRTWKHVGLEDSRHITRVRVHPKDPDLVYAAALGHLYGPNEERGVYRSKDGGATWERVLFVDDVTGAVDLAMDPSNPRVLYATFWQVKRTPWSLESGGPGSSLWKSTDGGDTWTDLSEKKGLPAAGGDKGDEAEEGRLWGISGVDVSPSNPDNVYAIIEAAEGGVFRSRDGGETWSRVNEERKLRQRAWYYTRIYADPVDEDVAYVVNVRFWRSQDGGRSWSSIRTPHGDNHDLWIAPENPRRMIEANDGGANVSDDGGRTWSTQANQPTSQIYRVSTDNAFPYRLLGAQQDNSALRIGSRSTNGGAIGSGDWEPTAGGESGYIVADPDEPDVVYGGSYGGFLIRYDHGSEGTRAVNVWPDDPMGAGAGAGKYRFQWNYPILFSPHDPDTLYAAGNVLFESTDEGQSWRAISPDLTRAVPETLESSGGPITKDNTAVEYYATIFAVAESPIEAGVIWAGSDDGLLHVTRDGGETWTDVTPGWPEWMQVNAVDAHPFEAAGAYVAGTRYKSDDFTPYLYRTTDWGKTWTRIDGDIPRDHFTRVVRADPERSGLLFAGTEQGMYVSFDDGATWRPFQLDLPLTPVTDLTIRDDDLIAATQGRGFWIMDDLAPLRQMTRETAAALVDEAEDAKHTETKRGEPVLFDPQPAWRAGGGRAEEPEGAGQNPRPGVSLFYALPVEPAEDAEVRMEILGPDGALIRAFTREAGDEAAGGDDDEGGGDESAKVELAQLPVDRGLDRVVWDLSYPGAESFPGMILWNRNLDGPTAVPGTYTARLTIGDWSDETTFEVLPDPRSSATPDDYRAQYDFIQSVRGQLTETHREIRRIRDVRSQLETFSKRLKARDEAPDVRAAADALVEKLTGIEETVYQTKAQSPQDPLNFPIRLNDKLAGVGGLASIGDSRPTDSMIAVRDELVAAIDAALADLRATWETDLAEVNRMAAEAGVDAVMLPALDPGEEASETDENDGDREEREEQATVWSPYRG